MDLRQARDQASCCGVNLAFWVLGVLVFLSFRSPEASAELVRGAVCCLRYGADHDGDNGLHDCWDDGADDFWHNGGDNRDRDHAGKEG